MKKLLKITVVACAITLLLAIAALSIFSFNLDTYRPQIVQQVANKTGYMLALDGPLQVKFLPTPHLTAQKIRLAQADSKPLFQLDKLSLKPKLMPLFKGVLQADSIELVGLHAQIPAPISTIQNKKSSTPQTIQEQLKIIQKRFPTWLSPYFGQLSLAGAKIEWASTNTANRWKEVKVDTLSIRSTDSTHLSYAIQGQFHLSNKEIPDSAQLKLTSLLAINPSTAQLSLDKLQLQLLGTYKDQTHQTEVEVRRLVYDLTESSTVGKTVHFKFQIGTQPASHLSGNIDSISLTPAALYADLSAMEYTIHTAGQQFKGAISSRIAFNRSQQQLQLQNLAAYHEWIHPSLPQGHLRSRIEGTMQANFSQERLGLHLSGTLNEYPWRSEITLKNFQQPNVLAHIHLDKLNLGSFLHQAPSATPSSSPSSITQATAVPSVPPAAAPPSALNTWLDHLTLNASMQIKHLKTQGISLENFHVGLKSQGRHFHLSPLKANLYQGSFTGSAELQLAQQKYHFSGQLAAIQMAQLLKDLQQPSWLTGKANFRAKMITYGKNLLKNAQGTLSMHMTDARLKTPQIEKVLEKVRYLYSSKDLLSSIFEFPVSPQDLNAFSKLNAHFKLKNGIAQLSSSQLQNPLATVRANGQIELLSDPISIDIQSQLKPIGESQKLPISSIPVRIHGPVSDLKYQIDARSLVQRTLKNFKDQLQEKLLQKVVPHLRKIF